ncbi:hypothetical protein ABMC89_14375 [Sulfitobacter sp. HNIBRBA3233]|uniref:hypothetical protein n=1 Tax=Sulfitobacter marinivivus TaxID=3158558 RepID=UPI0032DF07E7
MRFPRKRNPAFPDQSDLCARTNQRLWNLAVIPRPVRLIRRANALQPCGTQTTARKFLSIQTALSKIFINARHERKTILSIKMSFLAAALCAMGTLGSAQTFEEIISNAEKQVEDIGKYQLALQNPDPRMQYALIQQMLKLEDPALQRIAKEHALFSTNPVMREAAIKAILDSSPNLRIQFAGDRSAALNIAAWVTDNGGTYLENQGQVLYRVRAARGADCWGGEKSCYIRQVGNAIQLTPSFPNRKKISAVLNLGNDGVMRGTMNYNDVEFVQVQIDLKE